jgi:hypothetical protein
LCTNSFAAGVKATNGLRIIMQKSPSQETDAIGAQSTARRSPCAIWADLGELVDTTCAVPVSFRHRHTLTSLHMRCECRTRQVGAAPNTLATAAAFDGTALECVAADALSNIARPPVRSLSLSPQTLRPVDNLQECVSFLVTMKDSPNLRSWVHTRTLFPCQKPKADQRLIPASS